jgi:sigma-B regulation protein RsbU (phosphoserine phosphatase)
VKLLLVSPNAGRRTPLVEALSRDGFELTEAEGTDEARRLLATTQPAVTVLDCATREIDGVDLVRAAHSGGGDTLCHVLVLGSGSDPHHHSTMDAGADDILVEPYAEAEVVARCRVARRLVELGSRCSEAQQALQTLEQEVELFKGRVEHELALAARVQQSLLPTALPAIPGVSVAWELSPCTELAGDFLNVIRLDERHLGVYVADVSGHGVSAALLSAQLARLLSPIHSELLKRRIDRAPYYELLPPPRVTAELNRLFPPNSSGPHYFTLGYCLVDFESGHVRFTSAGHPGPIHVRKHGATAIEIAGTPIGLLDHGTWSEETVEMAPGDTLFSDGVIEARSPDGEGFGVERLCATIDSVKPQEPSACCRAIMNRLHLWCGGNGAQDDRALLILRLG